MEQAVAERLQEGVDSAVDLNKAKLIAARVRLHRAEARGSADVLRRHLSTLTGLAGLLHRTRARNHSGLATGSCGGRSFRRKRLPPAPPLNLPSSILWRKRCGLRASIAPCIPSIDFSAQYARFSTFNNYTRYFPKAPFSATTPPSALPSEFPLFNASQRARAEAAEAEALKAKKQAEATRNQVAEETLKLQRAAEQLEAAREVAQLEYQLAQSGLEAAQTRVDAKTGTLHELADARVQAAERFLLFQDADFEYQRVRMNLLRATGDLEKWALARRLLEK